MQRIRRERQSTLRDLQTLYCQGAVGHWPDAQLVECFATSRSEFAFAALVDRHGPMVLRVCRAVTGNGHTAEDAFQAVFLNLARKAATVRVREDLAPWLRTVAIRIATNTRQAESRRKRREEQASKRDHVENHHRDWELAHALHSEIDLLPRHLRKVILACDVEGLTHTEAALRLDCPVGTIKSRHARGRTRLRTQLVRRGIAPAVVVSLLGAECVARVVPDLLRSRTIQAAFAELSVGRCVGMVPALRRLISCETSTMITRFTMSKLGLTLTATVLGLGAGLVAVSAQDRAPVPTAFERTTSEKPAQPPRPEPVIVHDSTSEPPEFVVQPPSNDEVFIELVKRKYPNALVLVDKVGEKVEPARIYPLAGMCQQVTLQYKCTIEYLADPKTRRSGQEVVFIEKTHLKRVPIRAGEQLLVGKPAHAGIELAPSDDYERRLSTIEAKLDRLLEASKPAPSAPPR